MVEKWVSIAGFERFYEVSDLGRVRSLDREIVQQGGARTSTFTRTLRGRVLRPAPNPNGYLHVNLRVDNVAVSRDVHTLVLEAFVGPRPGSDMQACHNNGDNSDNRLVNLRWDTTSENALDRVRHGTHWLAAKACCPRNHALVVPNLVPSSLRRGGRTCLACSRGAAAIRNAARRGIPAPGTLQEISDRCYAKITTSKEWAS